MFSEASGRIDVHSHLLPGIDDGCATLEDSLACARAMVENGYTHMFCTPHIWPSLPNNIPPILNAKLASLQRSLDEHQIPLRLLLGGELNLTEATAQLKYEDTVTYGLRGRHLLIDMWASQLPSHFEPAIRHLQSMGLTVILAHPERMRAVQDQPALADLFAEMGVLLQCNLQCLGDPPHAATRRVAEQFLGEDRYFMIGSDLHNLAGLELRMRGLARAIEVVGKDKVWQLTHDNPARYLHISRAACVQDCFPDAAFRSLWW